VRHTIPEKRGFVHSEKGGMPKVACIIRT